jgi:hypothetical protein
MWNYAVDIAMMWVDIVWFGLKLSLAIVTYPCSRSADAQDSNASASLIHRKHVETTGASAKTTSSSGDAASSNIFSEARDRWATFVKAYAQPVKIALAVSIMVLFVVIKELALTSAYDALWGVIAVCVVRQENVSSSFLVGYQRLEGTAIGALYAFATYQLLKCDQTTCGLSVQLPVLVIWIAICAAFRDGPRHGYAAQTAALTPLILFLGSSSTGSSGPWIRIFETIVGVGIYLLIDNLILPNRSDSSVRQGVLECTEETRVVVRQIDDEMTVHNSCTLSLSLWYLILVLCFFSGV